MDSRLKTFIVEDNSMIRENLVGTLEELTCIVAVGYAEAEDEARDWLNRNTQSWELAIVDLFLKQGSGLGVLQGSRERLPHQKIVVLSNYATADIRKRCLQLDTKKGHSTSIDVPCPFRFATATGGLRKDQSISLFFRA
jgi:two-component system OmpR family response regulator